jgi:hypothetical protein
MIALVNLALTFQRRYFQAVGAIELKVQCAPNDHHH